ncbi:MAG: hypothetical protein ACK2UH_13405 [Candidatus Promineifilaceae bacterium]
MGTHLPAGPFCWIDEAQLRMMAQEKGGEQGCQADGQPGPQRTGRQRAGR